MCCSSTSMIKVTAFGDGGLFMINSDQIVKIVAAEDEEVGADGKTLKKVVDGVVIVLSNDQAHHVRESMSHFVHLFFNRNDDSV